jgi:hypothetical protein
MGEAAAKRVRSLYSLERFITQHRDFIGRITASSFVVKGERT